MIIASASADASGDESAAKYSEMGAILGVLGQIYGPHTLLFDPFPGFPIRGGGMVPPLGGGLKGGIRSGRGGMPRETSLQYD